MNKMIKINKNKMVWEMYYSSQQTMWKKKMDKYRGRKDIIGRRCWSVAGRHRNRQKTNNRQNIKEIKIKRKKTLILMIQILLLSTKKQGKILIFQNRSNKKKSNKKDNKKNRSSNGNHKQSRWWIFY